ncbi:alpha/beta fold hydrolase [Herbidospora galbida]|uniref:Alpha/beta fold hydrolase n=1 Tax=Herbidospora galbida TaxID=2575442 RepID=A0A4U3LSG0_9ACTN|nr:alpha/beta fold hydrolase [Herbidospora galbida]TKK78928.1 alpha/beta fold hydrolase [Herbidospora galbida]
MDALPLAWKEGGPPGDVPVVLIHGLTATAATWDPIAPALGRHWIAPEMRGHGASPRHADYTLDLMAADTLAFLDARGLTEIDLVGHSMGGRVATLVARERPGLVRRLVLEDSFPAPHAPQVIEPYVVMGDEVDFDPAVVDLIRAGVRAVDPTWWARLGELTMPVLVVGGAYSELVPQEALAEFTAALPDGRRVVLGAGHNVHAEEPDTFVKEVAAFLSR